MENSLHADNTVSQPKECHWSGQNTMNQGVVLTSKKRGMFSGPPRRRQRQPKLQQNHQWHAWRGGRSRAGPVWTGQTQPQASGLPRMPTGTMLQCCRAGDSAQLHGPPCRGA